MPQFLTTAISNHIATITLNRPEVRNAFNDELIAEITQAFTVLGADESVRVIVLAANGKAFCAGADLNWMRRMADYSYEQNMADARKLALMLDAIATCPKPTIAKVQGDVYAGGTGLVAACDMAVAVGSAHFCVSEVKIGLIPATISPYLIRAMGIRNAQRYWLTAEKFDAQEAKRMGLLTEVVGYTDALPAGVEALYKPLLSASPEAITMTKRLIESVADQAITPHLMQHTVEQIAKARASVSGKTGLQAFLNKTPAPWVSSQEG